MGNTWLGAPTLGLRGARNHAHSGSPCRKPRKGPCVGTAQGGGHDGEVLGHCYFLDGVPGLAQVSAGK